MHMGFQKLRSQPNPSSSRLPGIMRYWRVSLAMRWGPRSTEETISPERALTLSEIVEKYPNVPRLIALKIDVQRPVWKSCVSERCCTNAA